MSNVKHFQGQEEMENACSTGRASCVTRDTEPETDGKMVSFPPLLWLPCPFPLSQDLSSAKGLLPPASPPPLSRTSMLSCPPSDNWSGFHPLTLDTVTSPRRGPESRAP
ncbi:hypothetical protein RRG08_038280 [Elysia crispata]|uniref:Uncharacterized protein n=1 Tax=Elysia crispata TaxID=231223 RepID=A0AAE1AN41_9GAST|nr:hypothetical protein RRG08_038280 [Elysia crispata]